MSEQQRSVFGKAELVYGPESLLVDRELSAIKRCGLAEHPDAQVHEVQAASLDRGQLAEFTSGSLFSSYSIVLIRDAHDTPADLVPLLVELAVAHPDEVALGIAHPGGVKGKGLVDKLKKAKIGVVDCPAIKPWECAQFVTAEGRRAGLRLDRATSEALVQGVGPDPRALAAAVEQLISDAGDEPLTEELVRRYFAGRAEVTSFNVVDDIMAGNTRAAIEKLRWALETGVPGVLITSALASQLRALGKYNANSRTRMTQGEMAAVCGVAPFKVKDLAAQSRIWSDARVARALQLVAVADGDIKGQAGSAAFTLERLALALTAAPSAS
ncbi:MAG: DNA polymerase III subunit delta [Propionibacteriaceae bacterium]